MTEPVPHSLFDHEIAALRRDASSLKELLESQIKAVEASATSRIGAVEDAAKLALDAADKAAAKADAVFEKRMDTTNEWRGALDDALKSRASVQQVEQTKEQLSGQFDALKERVESTEKKLEAMLNKIIGFGLLIIFLVGVVSIVFAVTGQ